MSIIQLKEANCKSCYKCIRHCELKAISFHDEQARIVPEDCVLCGRCALVCPQDAKVIKSDVAKIQSMLFSGVPVYMSVAPSYVAAFPELNFAELEAKLRSIGFAGAEETAVGAAAVTEEYRALLQEGKMQNIFTTCCPTVVMLVEKYYPELIPCLAPVISPAVAHARILKKAHPGAKVVFLGPCISKKHEADQGIDIDAVLMFDELREWLKNIPEPLPPQEDAGMKEPISRLYPTSGGIVRIIQKKGGWNGYKYLSISGLDRCIAMLKDICENNISGYFIEMSSCINSCLGGPGLHTNSTPYLIAKARITDDLEAALPPEAETNEGLAVPMAASYNHTRVRDKIPDEKTIAEILASIGKTSEESMLNCGTCGYPTCRDKAIAVYQGKANLTMCLPYLREAGESLSNIIIESTPNALILTDRDYNILQYNRAAASIYGISLEMGTGFPATLYIDAGDLDHSCKTGEKQMDQRRSLPETGRIVVQSVLPLSNGDILVVAKDVTEEEEAHKRLEEMRRETLETTQQVIDKQMRVAQEIASLLGETTGESKAALIKLKRSLQQGE